MKKNKHVLIIDDDHDDIELFAEAVGKIDPAIKCSSAVNAGEALQRLRNGMELPALIFLDLNMPGLSGKDCLKELKKTDKLFHIPVAIYSTSSFQKDIEETRDLGAMYFITKPSTFDETCNTLSQIILAHVI
jgi:CheY-like chemotaxis protein